jgi:DNA-binding response OmpR family regulator
MYLAGEVVSMMNETSVDILYLEDDPLASRLLEEVCRSSRTPISVRTVRDRDAAVDALTNGDTPDLVMISRELGAVRGLSVLRALRQCVDLESVPVVVFGHSDDPDDITAAYESGADAYVQKPPNFSELLNLVEPLAAEPRRAELVGMSPTMAQQPHLEHA